MRHPRSRIYWRYSNWWRTALWIFWVDAIGFLLILTLNWFLTQNMSNREQTLPSPPHLPASSSTKDGREPPCIVLDGSGDSGGTYTPNNDLEAMSSFDRYMEKMGIKLDNLKGGSTNYDRYIQAHSPHTTRPIRTTTFSPAVVQPTITTYTEKTSSFMDKIVPADYDNNKNTKPKRLGERKSLNRIAKHLFNSFDNFGDMDLDEFEDTEEESSGIPSSGHTKLSMLEPSDDVARDTKYPENDEITPEEGIRWQLS